MRKANRSDESARQAVQLRPVVAQSRLAVRQGWLTRLYGSFVAAWRVGASVNVFKGLRLYLSC